jgi:hypothetical protein
MIGDHWDFSSSGPMSVVGQWNSPMMTGDNWDFSSLGPMSVVGRWNSPMMTSDHWNFSSSGTASNDVINSWRNCGFDQKVQ